jgi:hypothetical protein
MFNLYVKQIFNWYLFWYFKNCCSNELPQNFTLVRRISIGTISLGIYLKTLLKAKGRISFRGSFYLVKRKAFEIGGGISNLKNASCNLIPIPLTICKRF